MRRLLSKVFICKVIFLLKAAHLQIHLSATTLLAYSAVHLNALNSEWLTVETDGKACCHESSCLTKPKRFVRLAQTDFLPAAMHLSAILTPLLLISHSSSPSVTILDQLVLFGCSNSPIPSPWQLFTDSLTDRSPHERQEVLCEWIWMEPSICPSAIRPRWRWMLTARGERLKRIWKWAWCERGSNVFPRRKAFEE